MKYFTADMWKGLQDKKRYKVLSAMWDKAIDEYNEQFTKLKSRFSNEAYSFFDRYSLHDGTIISIEMLDEYNNSLTKEIIKQPTSLRMKIISGYDEGIFVIEYKNIVKLNLNYSIENPLFEYFYDGLGVIGYDELTEVDEDYLMHEFLFSTGSTIEIVFREVNAYRLKDS